MDDHHDVNLRAGEVPDGRQPSSTRPYHTRLDATSGREVVYCFKCDGEWYRDEHGIMPCPACHNDVTEVVSIYSFGLAHTMGPMMLITDI